VKKERKCVTKEGGRVDLVEFVVYKTVVRHKDVALFLFYLKEIKTCRKKEVRDRKPLGLSERKNFFYENEKKTKMDDVVTSSHWILHFVGFFLNIFFHFYDYFIQICCASIHKRV
jgi:hypothetical protein